MFCQKCGSAIPEGASACPNCSAPVSSPAGSTVGANGGANSGASGGAGAGAGAASATASTTASGSKANVIAYQAKAAGLDAWNALKGFAANPVTGLAPAYKALGDAKALNVGAVFGGVSVFCFLLGGYLMIPSFLREDFFKFFGFSGLLKLIFSSFVPFICVAACSFGARKAFTTQDGGLGGDCFIAGASLLPMSIWILLAGLLGWGNIEVIAILGIFASCMSILMLFAGYTRITQLSEKVGAWIVPVVVMLSLWLAKVLMVSTISGPGSSTSPSVPMFPTGGPSRSSPGRLPMSPWE